MDFAGACFPAAMSGHGSFGGAVGHISILFLIRARFYFLISTFMPIPCNTLGRKKPMRVVLSALFCNRSYPVVPNTIRS